MDTTAEHTVWETVYSPAHDLRLDVHFSKEAGRSPVVLYVHGGAFARGSRKDDSVRIRALVDSGLTVASVDYRLAPEHRYPAPIHDVLAAARYVREHSRQWGLPPGRVGVIGASAGGYLATMAGLAGWEDIGAVSPWFAPTDLWTSSRRSSLEERLLPVEYEANLVPELDVKQLRAASPVARTPTSAPSFLLAHGDTDRIVPVAESVYFHDTLSRAGVASTLIRVSGTGHEGSAFDGPPLVDMIAAWFRHTLE